MNRVLTFRNRLMLAGSCVLAVAAMPAARAADGGTSTATVNLGIGQAAASPVTENVISRQKARLLKEKNSPSAVTELGTKAISSVGIAGSPATLLRQAPSVYVYQQGLGDNAPELTVRGLRGLEIATTLDGIPTQDLLAPDAFYLANNLGGVFTLSQISNVHIYPGVAYPDKNTFGTIGGTIAYDSKRPTNDRYIDLVGSIGSFGTYKEGFEANSGAIDSPLGTGDNALKLLLNYYNFQTQGYIDGTPNRENTMEFAADKPYNDGLSDLQATVIYNTASGLIQNEPVPIAYLQKYGTFSNYPTNEDFAKQDNDFLTIILKDDTYINDYLTLGLTAYYLGNDQQLETYGAYYLNRPTGSAGPLTVNGASPFINNFAGFGYPAYLFGPPTPPPYGLYGGGVGGYFYGLDHTYDPYKLYPAGSKYCPTSYVNLWGGRANAPCGLNDQITGQHTDSYGIQPRALITLPEVWGISNNIKVGALIAKETEPEGYEFVGGGPNTPQTAQNSFNSPLTGGFVREIFMGYIQDKIDLFENTLHVTPGGTLEGTHSGLIGNAVFDSLLAPIYGPNGLNNGGTQIDKYGYYKATKWDREALPFINVSYDFDKIFPPLTGLTAYGSFGNSALFAPVGDFGPNTSGPPPFASIVHMYEGGVKYNTSGLLLSADYFYQKVDRDFGFFSFQSGPQNGETEYSDFGQRETKGVEANATWQITPQVQLFGNVSHLLAKYLVSGNALDTVAEDQYGTVFKGTPETGIPDWLSTFGVDYTRKNTIVDADDIHVRFTGQYTGHQNTTYDLGGDAYTTVPNYPGLLPLNYGPNAALGYNGCGALTVDHSMPQSCAAYTRYNQVTGATTYDPHGGISPFAIFNIDASYELPTPTLPVLKKVTFDLNIQNLFDQRYFQYFYKQISPANCGVFKSGPFYDPKNTAQTGLAQNNYSCTPSFADGIPGQPFSVFFTVTARF